MNHLKLVIKRQFTLSIYFHATCYSRLKILTPHRRKLQNYKMSTPLLPILKRFIPGKLIRWSSCEGLRRKLRVSVVIMIGSLWHGIFLGTPIIKLRQRLALMLCGGGGGEPMAGPAGWYCCATGSSSLVARR